MSTVILAFLNSVAWTCLAVAMLVLVSITVGRLLETEYERLIDKLHGRRWRPMTPYALAALLALAWLRASGAL